MQAVVDEDEGKGESGSGSHDFKNRSTKGETLNTMHLKQHWPSAVRLPQPS